VGPLAYRVDNHHDGIVSTRFWELRNEVYAEGVPVVFWNQEQLKFANREVSLRLSPKAQVAVTDILGYVSRHVWPPVVPGDELQHLKASGMYSHLSIMTEGDDAAAKFGGHRNVDAALVVQEAIAFRPLCRSE